ncbi:MAG: imidazole glycerol phosphate synthase subunit HisH [Chloroflexi bacterium]|nr:imidazole glycerol phosphate synthase subunit HisH [Chloroflexota bacterium]
MLAVVDYDAGNLRSITHGLRLAGVDVVITSDPALVRSATAIVVPGVGAASDTMRNLEQRGLVPAILESIESGKPFLGVCMGMQVLLTYSEEGGLHNCLNVLPGVVSRLPEGVKVPHMGWNQVRHQGNHPLFTGIPSGANFYFVHSFYPNPSSTSDVLALTEHGITFPSVIGQGLVMGTQFHPEKSGNWGLRLLRNFVEICREAA